MRLLTFLALILTAALPCLGQTPASAGPGLPKDPREVFAAAAPFYDFTSPDLKPWHLKATYQLYDEKGKPSEQGTYEYWWASPAVYRSTWTRPGATRTEWQTADGSFGQKKAGERLGYFEEGLREDFLSPLPSARDLDPAKVRLDLKKVPAGKAKLSCMTITSLNPEQGLVQVGSLGSFCFDPQIPILRLTYSFGTVATEFNKIVKMQNRYLAREILVFYGERELLSAQLDSVAALDPSDPALTPPPDALLVKRQDIKIGAEVLAGKLIKHMQPSYPAGAKLAHISGTVVLEATIGKDGKIHDPRVIVSPSPMLTAPAVEAVSQWEYKPYLLNGEPVEVETTINVIFRLGY
jgi:TonB family protein